jgi:hypothetical protein
MYQPRLIDDVEQLVELELVEETQAEAVGSRQAYA